VRFYQNSKCGYKDKNTGTIIVSPIYYAGSDFFEDIALVVKDNKRGYIDKKGNIVIPLIYEDASVFFSGLARVTLNHKSGYIRKDGTVAIPLLLTLLMIFTRDLPVFLRIINTDLLTTKGKL